MEYWKVIMKTSLLAFVLRYYIQGINFRYSYGTYFFKCHFKVRDHVRDPWFVHYFMFAK